MTLELHNVTLAGMPQKLSVMVSEGQMVSVNGQPGTGKTALVRAIMGFLPVSSGHICIDGELLTPYSAPYFRKNCLAYVPQQLSVPPGYHDVPDGYAELVRSAVASGKKVLIVDEPAVQLTDAQQTTVDSLLAEALAQGCAIFAINRKTSTTAVQL